MLFNFSKDKYLNYLVMIASNKRRIDERKCGVYSRDAFNNIFVCPCGVYSREAFIRIITVRLLLSEGQNSQPPNLDIY